MNEAETRAEHRGLYGTGHGKHGNTSGLGAHHAKLAVGAAANCAEKILNQTAVIRKFRITVRRFF